MAKQSGRLLFHLSIAHYRESSRGARITKSPAVSDCTKMNSILMLATILLATTPIVNSAQKTDEQLMNFRYSYYHLPQKTSSTSTPHVLSQTFMTYQQDRCSPAWSITTFNTPHLAGFISF
jgi:hypothetical protein